MLRVIHTTAATLFYALGGITVFAILFLRNGYAEVSLKLLLSVIDLPLIAAGLLWGSLSLWFNLPVKRRGIGWGIGFGAALLFLIALYFNFGLPMRP
jgi:hypothetical protein